MSFSGSVLLLSSFTLSKKNAFVRNLSSLVPASVAAYDLFLEKLRCRHDKNAEILRPAGS